MDRRDIEAAVWAAAFAAEYARDREICRNCNWDRRVDGFACAEYADDALVEFREAIDGPDREYLTMIKEEWVD